MEITIQREYDYIPEWNENKKEARPILFKMRRLTTSERDRFMALSFEDGKAAINPDRQAMFLAAVKSIEQLSVNGEMLKTARDMLNAPALDGLFTEVVSDILVQNRKEDLKKLVTAFAWVSEGEKLDCSKCTMRDKVVRGCNGERRWTVGAGFVWGCPNKLLTPEALKAIDAWGKWKKFGWPYEGGWADQPAQYFDVVEALENEANAIQARAVERAKNGNGN